MKVTKTEKIWLIVVTLFFILYNLPGVPPYGEAVPTLIHGVLTVIPIWVCVYVGLVKVYKEYSLREDGEESSADQKEDEAC